MSLQVATRGFCNAYTFLSKSVLAVCSDKLNTIIKFENFNDTVSSL